MVATEYISFKTDGFCDEVDITGMVEERVEKSRMKNGIALVFVPGSTGAITTMEYEQGLRRDIEKALEGVAPSSGEYSHDLTWGDGNGFSHVRSSLIGTSFVAPVVDGRLALGTWQQIVFLDFDNRARSRKLIVQLLGE